VDIDFLTSNRILYANTPIAVADPTATTTVMLILQTVRAASASEISVRQGKWSTGLPTVPDVRDLTVGIVGLGTIGKVCISLESMR
jgi:glyoxylate reductase